MTKRDEQLLNFLYKYAGVSKASAEQYESVIRSANNRGAILSPGRIRDLAQAFARFMNEGGYTAEEAANRCGISKNEFHLRRGRLMRISTQGTPPHLGTYYIAIAPLTILYTNALIQAIKDELDQEKKEAEKKKEEAAAKRREAILKAAAPKASANTKVESAPLGILDSLSRIELRLERIEKALNSVKVIERCDPTPFPPYGRPGYYTKEVSK